MKNWQKYFPFESPRAQQGEIIEKIIDSFEKKKVFILQAGTGIGKSAIGITVARYLNDLNSNQENRGAYFLTTQKILQEQYVKDFSKDGVKNIQSSSNFSCRYHKRNTCAQSMRILKAAEKGSRFWNTCAFRCPYKIEKQNFLESSLSVTNFPYFLAESTYAGKIQPRKLLVLDEAHNLPDELGKFVEIVVTEKFSKEFLNLPVPELKTHRQAIDWIQDTYYPKLSKKFKFMEEKIENLNLTGKLDNFVNISRQYEMLDKHLCKIRRFLKLHDTENWVYNLAFTEHTKSRRFEFKPIDVAPFAEEMVFKFGEKVLMMSATILNKEAFCRLLGLEKDEVEFIEVESPFSVKKRPIVYFPIGKMTKSEMDSSLPRLKEAVEKILINHSEEKGIIHCHTFQIANFLKKNIRSSRLLAHDSSNRDETLQKHIKSKKPTVLLSPSMTEGVDLYGELSRFQIVCKIPFPYLGDKLISKRMNKWKWWYPLQTSKTIVQSVGRSIRNDKDYAVTYILDSSWEYFYSKNKLLFPKDFKSCII